MPLRALARVDLGAIERNAARLRAGLAGGARLCAVVKADGYGHGAVAAARAALAGGAEWLAVATAEEARELRAAGIERDRPRDGRARRRPTSPSRWTPTPRSSPGARSFLAGLVAAGRPVRVHVKLDTGMGRLGTRDPAEATRVAEAVAAAPDARARRRS